MKIPVTSPDLVNITDEDSYKAMVTILNSLDALVYVADIQTHELLFLNEYGQARWGTPNGNRCWGVLQTGQKGPCEFCTNQHLLDSNNKPTGVYVWELQNTVNGRWYQCRDQAIRWIDGRMVRIEIATDITERKRMEQLLEDERKHADRLARTDMLTGLNNRREFFALGNQLFKQAARFKKPIALIMFDLDYFKQINDNHGHTAGDTVLKNISEVALKTVREADVLARLGGEEFAILLPQTHLDDAVKLAHRLQQAFVENPTLFQQTQIPCTASFGIIWTTTPGNTSLDELVSEADQGLYMAKRDGRNRCAVIEQSNSL